MSPTTDWFVAAGAKHGDGSREKPFHDPWLALFRASPGDIIHVAAGTYFGRYDRASWIIDCPNLTIRGGYSPDFSRRTPWQTPSVFAVFPGYEVARENNLFAGRSDHSGLVIDGLFFDASGRNTYADPPSEGIRAWPNMEGPIASFNATQVTIRNCVFANSANGGIELSGDASRFENNLVINIIGVAMLDLRSSSGENSQPIVVANNAFCFVHDPGPPCGAGGDQSIAVRIGRSAAVQDNVFVSCGNSAVTFYRDANRISIDRNLFFLTSRDIVNGRLQTAIDITEHNLDEIEDVGFKSCSGNVIVDPGLTGLRRDWLDAYSRHLLANYIKPPRDSANALRTSAGLPGLAPADLEKQENKGDFAPRLSPQDVLALRFTAKQGVHPADLAAEFAGQPVQPPPSYRPVDWTAIVTPDPSLANQRVALRAGLGQEQNSLLLADAPPETHMGIHLYHPGTDDNSIYVLAQRFTLPARQFDAAIRYNNGREVETVYLISGIYRSDVQPNSRQKVTLAVESILPAPFEPAAPPARPAGRDWFVKAGSSGGDGSREKPFRDPFQALDKAEGGDAIHVAAGDYFGKLRCGNWKIPIRNLTLLGGYDAEFSARDPWKNPTRFLLTPEERVKGIPEGTILGSEENSDGLLLDGFVFDGATYNTYTSEGSLDVKTSPRAPLVDLRGGRAITVRNCLFLNASGSAIHIACPSGVFENNVVLNTSGAAVVIRGDGPGPWLVSNNTLLFAADATARASTGRSSSDGTLLQLSGRAVSAFRANIFAFAEGVGIRAAMAQQNVSFENNVFAASLFNHLTDAQYLWADDSNWERRAVADSAFSSFQGNSLELPKLPVDPVFADAALTRLISLPSRISADQWKRFAAQIGSSVAPPAQASSPAADSAPAPTAPAKPEPAASASIGDLLASLSSMKDQMSKIEAAKPAAAAAAPLFCPVFDWKKAVALFQETPASEPGIHHRKLAVSFAPPRAQREVQYAKLTPQAIDAGHAAWDNKSVELLVTQSGSNSSNSSYFPVGLSSDDYDSYSAATVGDPTRVRLAILVRLDTAASKVVRHTTSSDKLRICGTARVPLNTSALSIVVDTAEVVGS